MRKIHAFGEHWALFRGQDRRVGLVHHKCRHAGANLCHGTVNGNQIQCPLHHWRYDYDGRSESATRHRVDTLRALTVRESGAVVYVFLGKETLYDVPVHNEHVHTSSVFSRNYPAPFQMVGLNGFDERHLGPVHGRRLLGKPEVTVQSRFCISINYKARVAGTCLRDRFMRLVGAGDVDITTISHGAGILIFRHLKYDVSVILGMLPIDPANTRLFLYLQVPKSKNSSIRRVATHVKFFVQKRIIMNFIKDDFDALIHSSFSPDGLQEDTDRCMLQWLEHYRNLPFLAVRELVQE